jgi:hypothetical protein
VLAGDPVEQPLTCLMRLVAVQIYVIGWAVEVNDMRQYKPQSETLAQASRDFDGLGGTERLVKSAHDGLHHRLPQTSD